MTLSTLLKSTRHAWAGDTAHGWRQPVVLPLHKSRNSYSFITTRATQTTTCNRSSSKRESIFQTQPWHLRAEASRSAAIPEFHRTVTRIQDSGLWGLRSTQALPTD